MRTNIHTHLFSADHTPSAQLYYLLRGALHGAARGLLPKILGRQVTTDDLLQLDRSMDRFEWPWPIAFHAAIGMSSSGGGIGLIDPSRLVEMFTTIARISSEDAHKVLGLDEAETEASLLQGLIDRTERFEEKGVLYPFRDALCELVADLFAAHESGVKKNGGRRITQEELWQAFLSSPGAKKYERVIVLSVNFDEAFLDDDLPGLQSSAHFDFAAQMTELENLAAKVNAEGGVQLLPFLGVDPRGQTASSIEAFVRSRVGRSKPWKGLKFYPPMGVLPADDRLRGVFDYCQDSGIPVLSHCSVGGAGVRGTNRNYADLAHPLKWESVLFRLENRYLLAKKSGKGLKSAGKFRLCLAHFDSLEEPDEATWCDEIMTLMERFDGKQGVEVYSDISFDVIRGDDFRGTYTANVKRVQARGLAKRVLFGSDWWNYLFECTSEKEFVDQLDIDGDWWRSADFEAAADAFLADVVPHRIAKRGGKP